MVGAFAGQNGCQFVTAVRLVVRAGRRSSAGAVGEYAEKPRMSWYAIPPRWSISVVHDLQTASSRSRENQRPKPLLRRESLTTEFSSTCIEVDFSRPRCFVKSAPVTDKVRDGIPARPHADRVSSWPIVVGEVIWKRIRIAAAVPAGAGQARCGYGYEQTAMLLIPRTGLDWGRKTQTPRPAFFSGLRSTG